MELPSHPLWVHFPIVLAVILPFLTFVFAFFIKSSRMNLISWIIIIGLNSVLVATGYLSMESGEHEEKIVKKVVSKKLIHEHEEMAEIFVGLNVVSLSLSVAMFFIPGSLGNRLRLILPIWGIIPIVFAFKTGELGGELVYKHGATRAYQEDFSNSLLPTPGMNTSESEFPLEE